MIVRESISFKRGTDPMTSMKVGLREMRKFPDMESFLQWLLLMLPYILKTRKEFLKKEIQSIAWYDNWEGRSSVLPTTLFKKICEWVSRQGDFSIGDRDGLRDLNSRAGRFPDLNGRPWTNRFREILIDKGLLNIKERTHESISFERGKDPRTTMGIGEVNNLKEKWLDLQQTPGIGTLDLVPEDNELLFKVYVSYIPGSFAKGEIAVQEKMGLDYFDNKKPWIKGPEIYYKIKDQYADLFIQAFQKIYGFNESVNFERGLDPKNSMGIGAGRFVELMGETGYDPAELRFIRDRLSSFYNGDEDKRGFQMELYDALSSPEEYNIDGDSGYYDDIKWAYDNIDWSYDLVSMPNDEIYDETNESINFERGGEPKTVMGIGHLDRIFKDMADDNWSYERDINGALQWASFNGNKEDVIYLLDLGADPSVDESMAFMEAIKEFNYDIANIFVERGLIDPDKLIQYFKYFSDENQIWYIVQYLTNKKKNKFQKKSIKESINFERGRDPKRAIGIGKSFMNLQYGDVIKLRKNLPGLNKVKGQEFIVDRVSMVGKDDGNLYYTPKDLYGRQLPTRWEMSDDWFRKNFDIVGNVSESINFERGIDPRNKMGIGADELIKDFSLGGKISAGFSRSELKIVSEIMGLSLSQIYELGFAGEVDYNEWHFNEYTKKLWDLTRNAKKRKSLNFLSKSEASLYQTKIGNIAILMLDEEGIYFYGDRNAAIKLEIWDQNRESIL